MQKRDVLLTHVEVNSVCERQLEFQLATVEYDNHGVESSCMVTHTHYYTNTVVYDSSYGLLEITF